MYGLVNIHASKAKIHHTDAQVVYQWLANLPQYKKVRHHVSGDFMKETGSIDDDYLNAVIDGHKVRPDLQGWTYTHAWKHLSGKAVNQVSSLTINASCDTPEEVEEALKDDWPATLVVAETQESGRIKIGEAETRLVICPHQTHGIQCSDCMLCFRKQRHCVVGFRVHGTGKSKFSV